MIGSYIEIATAMASSKLIAIIGCIGVPVLGVLGCLRAKNPWKFVSETTMIQVPIGSIISDVERPTEVRYCGTIDLNSAANVEEFITLNGLAPAVAHMDTDGWIHKGRLVRDVPRENYSNIYLLFGQTNHYSWEFVLDKASCIVRYQLLVPDHSGDLPGEGAKMPGV